MKKWMKAAAGALALSLFLFPYSSGSMAQGPDPANPYDQTGDGTLDQKDVSALLKVGVGGTKGDPASVVAYRGDAAQAAELYRYLELEQENLPQPVWGMDSVATGENVELALRKALNLPQKQWLALLKGHKLSTYDGLAGAREGFADLSQLLAETAALALEEQKLLLEEQIPGIQPGQVQVKLPQRVFAWKEMAGLYRSFTKNLFQVLSESAIINLTWEGETCGLSLEFPLFEEIAARGTREQQMNCRFALVYLNTVYDDEGVFQEYEPYSFSPAYINQLIHPLPGEYLIKDGWYDSRSRGTRMHTGTDIKAPARTPIRSITDGVVAFIGYMDIPGNYVVVRDRYGFEYHYYHMVEESKEVVEGQIVKQGDVIGLVGNTGNSAADHLHLAVISPEDTYINPYDMFLEAGIGPIKPRVEEN